MPQCPIAGNATVFRLSVVEACRLLTEGYYVSAGRHRCYISVPEFCTSIYRNIPFLGEPGVVARPLDAPLLFFVVRYYTV